jgi:hypothetical protein
MSDIRLRKADLSNRLTGARRSDMCSPRPHEAAAGCEACETCRDHAADVSLRKTGLREAGLCKTGGLMLRPTPAAAENGPLHRRATPPDHILQIMPPRQPLNPEQPA